MATVRTGARAALVVVDVQVGVMAQAWQAERVIGNVARVVARAREQGVPVLWVQHQSHELPEGSAAWQWVPALQPAAGEPRIPKRFNSAFEDTPFEAELARLGVSHLVLAGAATNWCIRATAYGALDRGYDVTLVSDAHSTEALDLGDGRVIDPAQVVAELNVAMTWLEYPGRQPGTAPAEQVNFHQPGGLR
jgi:nicotinamidase-related amidase